MKNFIVLALMALTLATNFAPANAQQIRKKSETTPATHMFIRNALYSVEYIPITTLEQCMMITQQSALLNSSTALCYFQDQLLKEYSCQKPVTKNDGIDCK